MMMPANMKSPMSLQPKLQLSDFDYQLPPELIAQHPVRPRDHSRLLVVDRAAATLNHHHFYDLPDFLRAGDVLVVNDSKVIPARLHGTKPTGGAVEVFLLQETTPTTWECLVRGKPGLATTITLSNGFSGKLVEKISDSTWLVEFNKPNITSVGEVPLPPYITEQSKLEDYQTVYAHDEGSVAAPTAGLHFTPELMQEIEAMGVKIVSVTLHVGLGTFAPVKTENIDEHVMHAEFATLPQTTADAIQHAKQTGHRVIAVGTTSARTLEAFHGQANSGWVNIFIRPGYSFNTVDALVTNFHLPKSTLLMLISALAGKSLIDQAYATAITERYRFFSFGDAMFIV